MSHHQSPPPDNRTYATNISRMFLTHNRYFIGAAQPTIYDVNVTLGARSLTLSKCVCMNVFSVLFERASAPACTYKHLLAFLFWSGCPPPSGSTSTNGVATPPSHHQHTKINTFARQACLKSARVRRASVSQKKSCEPASKCAPRFDMDEYECVCVSVCFLRDASLWLCVLPPKPYTHGDRVFALTDVRFMGWLGSVWSGCGVA